LQWRWKISHVIEERTQMVVAASGSAKAGQ
jgi:hypothetical protein